MDRDAALAWARRERERCNGCGQARSDLVDEHGVELRDLPVAAVDWYCPGCAAIARHDKARGDTPPRPGVATALVSQAFAASLAVDDDPAR